MTAEERADLLNDIQTMLIEKGYPLYVGGYEDEGELFEVILCVEKRRTTCLECDEYNHEKYYCPIFCDVIRQTVNEMQGWIPRSEREPDTGNHILITVLWEKGVDTAFDNDYEVMEEDWAVGEYEIRQGTATPLVKRIHERTIAWMPMPKPYRRKEE